MSRTLGLTAVGSGISTGAGAGSTKTQFTKIKTLSVGGAIVSDQPFLILDLDLGMVMTDGKQQAVVGILGLELIERFVVTMNYKDRTVTLRTPSRFTCQGSAVPIRFTSDMPLAMATLDDHNGSFGIDTSNNGDLIIFRHWALSHQLLARYENGDKMDSSTSVGGDVKFTMAEAKSFQIGGQELGAIRIMLASDNAGSLSARSEAGNIGNSILSHFTVTFDYRAEIMCLQR